MSRESSANASTIISAALRQTSLAGYSEVLGMMAKALNSYGCVLWQLTPRSERRMTRRDSRLFISASWFDESTLFAHYELPVQGSPTGLALLSGQTVNVPDVQGDPRVHVGEHVLSRGSLRAMCCVPFNSPDEAAGALNFYRTTPEPFGESDLRQAEQFAALVPDLY